MNDTSGFNLEGLHASDSEYRVLRMVHESESGFCRILEVRRAGRIFIAKCLKPEYRDSKVHIEFLKREFDILSSLYHPSIVQAFGIENLPEEGPAIILEYAHGITLQAYIESGEITPEIATSLLGQICTVMDYCHQRSIIHRDLKPSNIMVHPQGRIIKLIDFNLSSSPSFIDAPLPGGTEGFSAPEQFEVNHPALPSSDIYSIGKIMKAMLPKGVRNWKMVAQQCSASSPGDRPASAGIIPGLLKRKVVPRKAIIFSILSSVVLLCGILFFIFNSTDKENYYSEGLPSPNSNDSILSANPPLEMSEAIEGEIKNESYLSDESGKAIITEGMESQPKKERIDTIKKEKIVSLREDLLSETKKRAEEAAALRFKEQISILDTATHYYTIALAKAGHWRWNAKQDMAKWIKDQNLSSTEETQLTQTVKETVTAYEKAHYSELKKALTDAFYKRRVIWVMNPPETQRTYIGNNEYQKQVLGEDGVWRKVIEKGSAPIDE